MPPVGFEPTTPAGERPQTYALDRTATGTGTFSILTKQKHNKTQLILSANSYMFRHI